MSTWAETDSTSLADTSAGIYANGKVQTKKETFYLIYSEGHLCIYRGDDKIFYRLRRCSGKPHAG